MDGSWKEAKVEPEAVAVVEVNTTNHREVTPEPQQSLFTWAEFVATSQ